MKCNLCGKEGLSNLYSGLERRGNPYDLYQCSQCGLGVTSPVPNKEQLAELYSSQNYRAHEKRFIFPIEQLSRYLRSSRLKKIEKFSSSGRMLDIGCGRGLMLAKARAEGWEVYGLEFNDDTALSARDVLGLDVRIGDVECAGFESESFDVITIWHVLEHLEDPFGTIMECKRLLKKGGLLVVSVPNLDSIQAQLSKRYWFHLDVPYHLYHFTTKNISHLLSKCSFSILNVSHFSLEQSVFGFLQSLFNMTGLKNNFLYDFLKTRQLKTNDAILQSFITFFITIMLIPAFFTISLILTVLEIILKRGGSIEIYARKEEL